MDPDTPVRPSNSILLKLLRGIGLKYVLSLQDISIVYPPGSFLASPNSVREEAENENISLRKAYSNT